MTAPRLAVLALALALSANAQTTPQPEPQPAETAAPNQPSPPPGKVLFSRDATTPEQPETQPAPKQDDKLAVTDAERSTLTFTAYDLDVHLTPTTAGIAARAGLTLRNDSAAPLSRLVLQITSSLHWDAFSSAGKPLPFAQHNVDTDADHTGEMEEAVVTLPQPLTPGATIAITALYSGTIVQSAHRLERIGAPDNQSLAADWDAISPDSTSLRGFGNVLWYPVAAAPVFLGDGAKLFQSVGATKLRQSSRHSPPPPGNRVPRRPT